MYTDEQVVTAITHCVTTTRLEHLVNQATEMVNGVGALAKTDPDVKPELQTVLDGLTEVVLALLRAHDFSKARVDVRLGDVL